MKKSKIYIMVLLIACCRWCLFAEKISFSADTMKRVMAAGKEKTLLDGHATIETGAIVITSDHIEIYGKNNNYVYSESEEITVINKESGIKISCQNLFYDRDIKVLRIHGNAVMEDKKNEVIIKGGYIEHWEDKNLTYIQIGVRILKVDLACRAEAATYKRDEDRLELSGMPVVIKEGDEFKALKININLKNNDVELIGNVEGDVTWEDEKGAEPTQGPTIEPPKEPAKEPTIEPVVEKGTQP